ncbi:hypothetical protein [Streptomyces sp. NBC_00459]
MPLTGTDACTAVAPPPFLHRYDARSPLPAGTASRTPAAPNRAACRTP